MSKNTRRYIQIIIGFVALLGIIYFGGVGYYADRFLAGTHILGVEVGGLSLEEGQAEVTKQLENSEIQIQENRQPVTTFTLSELGAELNSDGYIEGIYKQQDARSWFTKLFKPEHHTQAHTQLVNISHSGVREALSQEAALNLDERQPSIDAKIDYTEDLGYHIVEEQVGNMVEVSILTQNIINSLESTPKVVELSDAYVQPTITKDDELLTEHMAKINATLNTNITLNIEGSQETLTSQQIEEWMYFDSENNLKIDRDLVYTYLGGLNEKYATYDKHRAFKSTNWGDITIEPGTLGWSIDRSKEADYIATQLELAQDSNEEPYINGTGYGQTSIGTDYVEVDLTEQHMYVYIDNALVLDTPIVSGQVGTDTVPGAYAVWNKESPSNLTGYNPRTGVDYVQPVSYWIAFDDTGQGIHDANWQSNFGGETYKVSGSLGCINTPPNVMPNVYELVYNGMPVIVH